MSELIKEKRIVSLNSNNATTYNNGTYLSDMIFDFPCIIKPDPTIAYIEVGLGQAEIVASFYNIDLTNNIFNYRVNATNFNITVPIGSYNYNTLVTQMTTLFTANGHTMVFTRNVNSNILTMTLSSGGTWNNITASSIYYILGFVENTTYNIVANTITFPFMFNLIGIKKLKIYSTNLSIDSYDSVDKATSNLLATISVNQPSNNLLVYSNIESLYGHFRNKYLSTIDISIKDEFGRFVNFNNINWTMVINIIIYRRIDVILKQLTLNENVSQLEDTSIPPTNA